MSDIARAKELLRQDRALTCVFVRGEEVKTSSQRGVSPLLKMIDSGERLEGWSAADRVVGRGAALLYAYLGVSSVFGDVLSRPALEIFQLYKIPYEYDILTEGIVNRTGDGPCPMEAATRGILLPEEGLSAIRKQLKAMRSKS